MNRKTKSGLIAIVVILGLAYAGDIAIKLIKLTKNREDLHPQMRVVHTISEEDSSIFTVTALQQLKVEFALQDNYRQVSFCILNKQYQMILAKADLGSSISLPVSVHVTEGHTEETDFEPYKPEELKDHGDFLFRLAPLGSIDNMFITYSGGTMKPLISNDSLLHYHVLCSNLSIRYASDSPVDVCLSSGHDNNSSSSLNLDLILIRRNAKIYFLFILPINYRIHVDPVFAGELLKE